MPETGFFVVCNSKHFVALVTLINSLRDVGHREPIYVTDCGLTEPEREHLSGHAEVLPGPKDLPPTMLKMYGPLTIKPELAAVVDADLLFRRSIADLLDGFPTMFTDCQSGRFHEGWHAIAPQRFRHTYLSAGTMLLTSDLVVEIDRAVQQMLDIVADMPFLYRTAGDPFHYGDQDAINGLFGNIAPDRYRIEDLVAYWPFQNGVEGAAILHHILPKPWLVPRRRSIYSQEMIRLLTKGPILLPPREIQLRFHPGAVGGLARSLLATRTIVRERTRGKLGIRARLGYVTGSRHFTVGGRDR